MCAPSEDQDAQEDAAQGDAKRDQRAVQDHLTELGFQGLPILTEGCRPARLLCFGDGPNAGGLRARAESEALKKALRISLRFSACQAPLMGASAWLLNACRVSAKRHVVFRADLLSVCSCSRATARWRSHFSIASIPLEEPPKRFTLMKNLRGAQGRTRRLQAEKD